jgi:hypothetical protein
VAGPSVETVNENQAELSAYPADAVAQLSAQEADRELGFGGAAVAVGFD